MNTVNENGRGRAPKGAWLLAGAALLVGVDLGARLGDTGATNVAYAEEPTGVVNPADQRRQMIAELRKMNDRLDRIAVSLEKSFNGGPVDVAVVEFPKNLVVSSE